MVPWLYAESLGDVHVGAALNVFTSFGDLGAEVKITGQENPWYSDLRSSDVFEQVLETRR